MLNGNDAARAGMSNSRENTIPTASGVHHLIMYGWKSGESMQILHTEQFANLTCAQTPTHTHFPWPRPPMCPRLFSPPLTTCRYGAEYGFKSDLRINRELLANEGNIDHFLSCAQRQRQWFGVVSAQSCCPHRKL